MQLVASGLVIDVEEPVLDRKPVASKLLPLEAYTVAAGGCQKVQSLQAHPEVPRAARSESVLVIVPRQVPVKPAR